MHTTSDLYNIGHARLNGKLYPGDHYAYLESGTVYLVDREDVVRLGRMVHEQPFVDQLFDWANTMSALTVDPSLVADALLGDIEDLDDARADAAQGGDWETVACLDLAKESVIAARARTDA